MNIMSKLALRQMNLNRRRTMVTILGVIISVAMITAVSTFAGSFMDMFQRIAIANNGDWHVMYEGVPAEKLSLITDAENTENSIIYEYLGSHKLDESSGGKAFVSVLKLNEEGLAPMGAKILTGRFPQSANELVVSSEFEEREIAGYAIGDTVALNMGKRYYKDDSEQASVPYPYYAMYSKEGEVYKSGDMKSYTIVGIVDMGNFEQSWNGGFLTFTVLDQTALVPGEQVDVKVKVNPLTSAIGADSALIAEQVGVQLLDYNNEVLFYSGISDDKSLLWTFYIVGGILMLIIMIGSIALIYNSFAISISERSKQFGMLASVGATNRQKRNTVFVEAGLIGAVAIPLGILFGLLGIGITFKIVSPMIVGPMNVEGDMLHLVVWPSAVVTAIIVSLLTIFISAWIPAKRAARFTPIDAIRASKDINLKGKEVRTSKLTRKLFGFEAEIALKNLKRNKKRYWITLFSLVISLVLFLSACSFTYYLKGAFNMTHEEVDSDLMVHLYSEGQKDEKLALLDDISKIPGAEKVILQFQRYLETVEIGEAYITEEIFILFKEDFPEIQKDRLEFSGDLNVLDENTMKTYAQKLKLDWSALTDAENPTAIAINQFTYQKEHDYKELYLFKNSLKQIQVGFHPEGETSFPLVTLNVAAATKETPFEVGRKSNYYDHVEFYLTQEAYEGLLKQAGKSDSAYQGLIFLNCADSIATELAIDKLLQKPEYVGLDCSITNISEQARQNRQMFMVVDIFVFGFVTLIALIGTANIFNTISTSLILRKREFAMLKSVGMSPKSFRKMIRFESLFYGIKAILYGMPISFIAMIGIYLALSRNFDTIFSIPWASVIIGAALIFILVSFTMFYASRRLKKDNVVETLRSENI